MFEIRSYHFEPARFEDYKVWAKTQAVPYIRTKMDVVGFWVSNGMEPEYGGSATRDENVPPANVTWVIRWRDRAHRDEVWTAFRLDPNWVAILARVPGGRPSYLRTEAKFAAAI